MQFVRGDVDGSGDINITDAIASLLFQFGGRFTPTCEEALDLDNDGHITIADPVASLGYQFLNGLPPAEPFMGCGKDPDFEPYDC